MRMTLSFRPAIDELAVPVHYNHLLQALVYKNIEADLATWLHDSGYTVGARTFKLFVFSRLFGRFERRADQMVFRDRVQLHIASPITNFIESLGQSVLRSGIVQIGQAQAQIERIDVEVYGEHRNQLIAHTASPITAYSTLLTAEGSKKTYYFSPFESEFAQQIETNLRKKYQALTGAEAPADWRLRVTPLGVRSRDQALVLYKGIVIRGWAGRYRLDGSKELIKLALETGLGSKNSQGFGMIRPALERSRDNA